MFRLRNGGMGFNKQFSISMEYCLTMPSFIQQDLYTPPKSQSILDSLSNHNIKKEKIAFGEI
jgi:hypothetical protein